jgi:Transposase DDE domain.
MHALTILQRCVAPLLAGIHRRRLSVLLEAVAATVSGPRLTLTEIGRRFGGGTDLRHRINRADRLLANRHLHRDAKHIDAALARMLLAGVAEPLIVIDWSDLKADQSLHLLRASVPVGGRSLTLYEEVHPQCNLGNRRVQHRFLQQLKALLPATAEPIIIADSGFKVPFYREVERLGWRWVGRVRGRDFVKLKHRWRSCKRLFAQATTTATALGIGEWVRSNPLRAAFVLVRKPKQGRRAKTAAGKRSRSKKSQQGARNAREPWLLVASTRLADWPAKRLVRVYRPPDGRSS